MSTLQQTQSNSFSPLLLSPSSTTITNTNHHFDNSDQGSVDSDYTSLGSSKFYGHSGSTSSLHRQGRSQSIDELASTTPAATMTTTTTTTTTTIPTRHFNSTTHPSKSSNDPLQFVKIHPNHELIERAQEQLTLAESRKRLQDTYKLGLDANGTKIDQDEDNDWTKVSDRVSSSCARARACERGNCSSEDGKSFHSCSSKYSHAKILTDIIISSIVSFALPYPRHRRRHMQKSNKYLM